MTDDQCPSMTQRPTFYILLTLIVLTLASCDSVLGSKSDETTDEIFEAGRIPPTLVSEAEYVPLFPFLTLGGDGAPLEEPEDIYVGYDELIYVVDARGLHILDLAGRPAAFLPLDNASSVTQDRRLHLFVTARRDTMLNNNTWNLPVVYEFSGLSTGTPTQERILWHPFDDDSRKFNRPDPISTDEEVAFTGVAILPSGSIYVSRRGPINDRTSVILPHNTILEFTREGINVQAILALNPTRESLRSAINPADVITFVHPPQRDNFTDGKDFIIAQSPYPNGTSAGDGLPDDSLRFSVLSINAVVTADGIEYRPDSQKLQVANDPTRGDGFLYEEFKFRNPTDMAFAADGTNYIYVIDAGRDSLYAFTNNGVEGVAPPPGSNSTIPVNVSFGGTGDGALQFNNPQGVSYFNRIVYVADTGNNRISRYRLNTDFE